MSLWQSAKIWGSAAVDLLYPETCAGCHLPQPTVEPHTLCAGCLAKLRRIHMPYCQTCCESFSGQAPAAFRCSNCSDRQLAFDFAVCAYESMGLVREFIHQLKYERQIWLRGVLGWLLSHAATEPRLMAENWILTPVPLHPRRFREREYNQSAELARAVASRLGWPVIQGLKRTRYTTTQARLDRQERLRNLQNAFALKYLAKWRKSYAGKNVLLVDDVFTTGATAHECARILKDHGGAAKVVVFTVARG